jgi:sirohydrochlorin ferrochelatase
MRETGMSTRIVLIAHGSREAEANRMVHDLAKELAGRTGYPVEPAFLELTPPTVDDAAAKCVEQGAQTVIITPYFLAPGVHVRRDLEAARQRLGEQYPHVDFLLANPLGPHKLLVEILSQRIANCLQDESSAE